jgi:hypothetical protein
MLLTFFSFFRLRSSASMISSKDDYGAHALSRIAQRISRHLVEIYDLIATYDCACESTAKAS